MTNAQQVDVIFELLALLKIDLNTSDDTENYTSIVRALERLALGSRPDIDAE